MREAFRHAASTITGAVGSPFALLAAVVVILAWAASGPLFGFSDTWQLAINTGTTIVTFLMVFVIQATQNREARATQIKLDELIRAMRGARNELIAIEEAPDEVVAAEQAGVREIVEEAARAGRDAAAGSRRGAANATHAASHGAGHAPRR